MSRAVQHTSHLTDRPARFPPTRSSSPSPTTSPAAAAAPGCSARVRATPPPREGEARATHPRCPGGQVVVGKAEMVFVWLTAFFLVVALIVLVIYQVTSAPPRCESLDAPVPPYDLSLTDSPRNLRRPLEEMGCGFACRVSQIFQWFRIWSEWSG